MTYVPGGSVLPGHGPLLKEPILSLSGFELHKTPEREHRLPQRLVVHPEQFPCPSEPVLSTAKCKVDKTLPCLSQGQCGRHTQETRWERGW